MTINRLKLLAIEQNRLKYPTFPDHLRPQPKYSDKTANGLTKCVIDWITFNGYQAERISTMGRVIDNRQTYTNVIGQNVTIGSTTYIPGAGTKGSADISATIKNKDGVGVSIKIEVKIGKDRQSEAQKQYQANIERSGGVYLIARNFTDFVGWWDNFVSSHT